MNTGGCHDTGVTKLAPYARPAVEEGGTDLSDLGSVDLATESLGWLY